MSTQLLTFAQGSQDVGTITINSGTPNDTGAITFGSAESIFGYLATMKMSAENATEEVSAVTSPVDNNIKLSGGVMYDVSCFLRYGDSVDTPVNAPRAQTFNDDYIQLSYTLAGVDFEYVGLVKNYSEDVADKGKILATFQLLMVDIGGPNPVLT